MNNIDIASEISTPSTLSQKPKKLKLKEFEFVTFGTVGVNVIEVPYQNEEGNYVIGYGASLVILVNSQKTQKFPIVLELSIADDCPIRMAYRALTIANEIAYNVNVDVLFLDSQGELIDNVSSSAIIKKYEFLAANYE